MCNVRVQWGPKAAVGDLCIFLPHIYTQRLQSSVLSCHSFSCQKWLCFLPQALVFSCFVTLKQRSGTVLKLVFGLHLLNQASSDGWFGCFFFCPQKLR